MLPGVPPGSNLGPVLINIFINKLCSKIHFSGFLLFAVDLKIFRIVESDEVWKLLHSDIDSVQKCCIENYMKSNIFKTNMISFTRKTFLFF
jgi:hypothetical protein